MIKMQSLRWFFFNAILLFFSLLLYREYLQYDFWGFIQNLLLSLMFCVLIGFLAAKLLNKYQIKAYKFNEKKVVYKNIVYYFKLIFYLQLLSMFLLSVSQNLQIDIFVVNYIFNIYVSILKFSLCMIVLWIIIYSNLKTESEKL